MDPSSFSELALLPQYGFGATYAFEVLAEDHHFLYRVHTPKRRGTLSRPSSPSPRPASPFATPHRPPLTRSPSSLSTSVASIRTLDNGPSDYFTFDPGRPEEEDDTAPGDPYFLSRRFKDDLTSPDPGRRRRTLSTLSTLSGGSGSYSFIGSDDGSDAESAFGPKGTGGNLSRSASVIIGHSRARSDSLSDSRPGARRSQSADIRPRPSAAPQQTADTEGSVMTYSDLVRHLDWTTRSNSPYVTTSFSFFWCLWDAVRRYKLAVKHDVEIAVIDARKVRGRAKTALEVLRGVEADKQDKAYWKWYRFALESQDVLVFGAIPGDAIYASIPLTQILPKLPSYFFVDDVPKPVADPRERDAALDPRSPTTQARNPVFPTTPGRPQTPHQERDRDRALTAHLLSTLAWDVGTTLKPTRKSKDASSSSPRTPAQRHTSHADFCKTLSAVFTRRSEADQLRDATTGAVSLAELLIEPWFRARCAEGVAYPFRHDSDDSDDENMEDSDKMNDSVCLGLAGDGCSLEHSHDSSIQDALFAANRDDETEEEAARREAAAVLSELALCLARWPAEWWYAEHANSVEGLINDVVGMCVSEASRGVQGRIAWGIALEGERERRRRLSGASSVKSQTDSLGLSGSLRSERRGREETRERSRSPFGVEPRMKHVRHASEGSPSPKPWPSRDSPYKPRARSPLGTTPALGPAIIIRPKSRPQHEDQDQTKAKAAEKKEQEQKISQTWSPSTPPPSPPLTFSQSEGNLRSVSPKARRSPPPTPPPRSSRRPPSPPQSLSSSLSSFDSPSPSPKSSPSASLKSSSLLKQSVHRRAESIPGGWPGGDDVPEDLVGSPNKQQAGVRKEEEGDVFWDPSLRPRVKARPLSWAGSGIALGAASSPPGSNAGSRKSSVESLRSASQSSASSSPSSSLLRTRSRTQSDAQEREALLAEVVQSALGFGAGVVAGSSGSPLRVDITSSSTSVRGTDRPSALTHHRRHSSHGLVHPLETELSPVREVEQEDEAEVEKMSHEQSAEMARGEDRTTKSVSVDVAVVAAAELVAEPTQIDEAASFIEANSSNLRDVAGDVSELLGTALEFPIDISVDNQCGATALEGSGASTPRSERRLSRSSTLASIPEEDWTEWALVEAPSVSEYEAETMRQISRLESRMLETEIPLPPSPPPEEPRELDGNVQESLISRAQHPAATESDEQDLSGREGVRQVPEITLSVDGSNGDSRGDDGTKVENVERNATASETSNADETSNALSDSRAFRFPLYSVIRAPLSKTHAVLRTFLALPALGLLRWTSPAANVSSVASPVFEDTDPADIFLRLSPLFSLFRIPFLRPGSCSLRRREVRPARPLSLILAPPSAWDAPILGSDCDATGPTGEIDGAYWDPQSTRWAMSCFVCGVMATLALAAIQQQRCEMYMMVGNRYH